MAALRLLIASGARFEVRGSSSRREVGGLRGDVPLPLAGGVRGGRTLLARSSARWRRAVEARGSRFEDRGSRIAVRGSRYEARGRAIPLPPGGRGWGRVARARCDRGTRTRHEDRGTRIAVAENGWLASLPSRARRRARRRQGIAARWRGTRTSAATRCSSAEVRGTSVGTDLGSRVSRHDPQPRPAPRAPREPRTAITPSNPGYPHHLGASRLHGPRMFRSRASHRPTTSRC